jgi:hypothetical protein
MTKVILGSGRYGVYMMIGDAYFTENMEKENLTQ